MNRRITPQHVRSDSKSIVGVAAVFANGSPGTQYNLMEGVVERIRRGAFDRALREKQDVRCLYNHDPNLLLGRLSSGTLRLWVDAVGLNYEIKFDPADGDHANVKAKIARGDLSGSSFAFRPTKVTWERGEVDVRWIEDLDLMDVGPVTFPAYEATAVGLRSEDILAERTWCERRAQLDALRRDFAGAEGRRERLQMLRRLDVLCNG